MVVAVARVRVALRILNQVNRVGWTWRERSWVEFTMSLKSLFGEAFSALQVPGNEPCVSDGFSHAVLRILLWAKRTYCIHIEPKAYC